MTFWLRAFIGSAVFFPFFFLAVEYPSFYSWGLAFVMAIAANVWVFSKKAK
jgi:hypothetical protein